jgi:hypothetical protein
VEHSQEWTSENTHCEAGAPESDNTRAKELADQFLVAAAAAGIPKSEIDDAVDDLTSFMASQIQGVRERDADEQGEE